MLTYRLKDGIVIYVENKDEYEAIGSFKISNYKSHEDTKAASIKLEEKSLGVRDAKGGGYQLTIKEAGRIWVRYYTQP